jgi:hypothetical protein
MLTLSLGEGKAEDFRVDYSKSKVVGSHSIAVIDGRLRHRLIDALERIVLQANAELRAERDKDAVEGFKREAERDARKKKMEEALKRGVVSGT